MKIVSVFVNNPHFIELQYNSIKKFFKTEKEYEFIIFNDAKEPIKPKTVPNNPSKGAKPIIVSKIFLHVN
jgi:hypothetical protein